MTPFLKVYADPYDATQALRAYATHKITERYTFHWHTAVMAALVQRLKTLSGNPDILCVQTKSLLCRTVIVW